jgi:VWFA-related protein
MAGHRSRQVAIGRGRGTRDWGFALIATLIAIGAFVNAQVDPQPGFRSQINYIQIPVRVLDARGEFVRGLTQSDFQILEDGAPQTIAAFSAVDIPFVRKDATVPGASLTGIEGFASDESNHVDGRVYAFVLDNQNMPDAVALRTRHVMRRFISDGLAGNDVAAIVMTGTGRGQPLTRSRELLNDALDRLMGDADPSDHPVERTMQTIADAAQSMGAIKGRRKALVLVTPSPICMMVSLDLTVFSNCNEAVRYALRTAAQADVSIYTIDPRGLVPTHGAPAEFADRAFRIPIGIARGPLDAARYLAEESGGFAVVNTNSLADAFARVAREHSAYYLLGYYSTNTRPDGKLRRNQVTVSRTSLRVLHRNGYLAPRENP